MFSSTRTASQTSHFLSKHIAESTPQTAKTPDEQPPKVRSKQDASQQAGGRAPAAAGPAQIRCLAQVSNSALVHHRAASNQSCSPTAGQQLAAASVQAAASLPLMIGNRSKCVVNLLDDGRGHQDQQANDQAKQRQQPPPQVNLAGGPSPVGPQAALRAEQRRRNMSISVVRPVVVNGVPSQEGAFQSPPPPSCHSSKSSSLIDDWMSSDKALASPAHQCSILDELLGCDANLAKFDESPGASLRVAEQASNRSEQQARQQALLMRREQHELNKAIRRQHQFIVSKLEQRRRHLSIIQAVWFQRDFKNAMEKLVDIYHQGLIFTDQQVEAATGQPARRSTLRSLNTSLVVDVIGVIVLRPRLWTLEICQLLLPIINSDLLVQVHFEHYHEVGLKALKLILAHFAPIIQSTLESLKESSKLVGVDLSREDRICKCLACYKLLLESQSIIVNSPTRGEPGAGAHCKLAALRRDLKSLLATLFSSIRLDSASLLAARRFQADR